MGDWVDLLELLTVNKCLLFNLPLFQMLISKDLFPWSPSLWLPKYNQSSVAPSSQELIVVARLRDFLRMNTLVFTGSKVEELPHNFINEM